MSYKDDAKASRIEKLKKYADGGRLPDVSFTPDAVFGKNGDGYQNYRLDSNIPLGPNTDLNVSSRLSPNESGPGKHGYGAMIGLSKKFKNGGHVK